MIIDFSFKNFKSFKEETVLSFVASEPFEEHSEFVTEVNLPGLSDLKLLKVMGIYGSNASGKSNVLEALRWFFGFVTSSHKNDIDEGIERPFFKLQPEAQNAPTEFCLRFIHEGIRYHLTIELNNERIIYECLEAFPDGKSQTWYERIWENEDYTWESKASEFHHINRYRKKNTRPNVLYLSKAADDNDRQMINIFRYFKQDHKRREHLRYPENLASYLYHTPETLEYLNTHIPHADLGISHIHVSDQILSSSSMAAYPDLRQLRFRMKGSAQPTLSFIHQGGANQHYSLAFHEESDGTQKFVRYFSELFHSLQDGAFECMDELENQFHPLMVRHYISQFASAQNQYGAQLLFTTHDATLLDKSFLRHDQFWFTEKDATGQSTLSSLIEYSSHEDKSLMQNYLSGIYGAIPHITPLENDSNPSR